VSQPPLPDIFSERGGCDTGYCQVVAYGRLKTKENFKLLALKVVAVAYERWSLSRGIHDWETFGILEN